MEVVSSVDASPLSACQAMCSDTDWSNQSPYAPPIVNALSGVVLGDSLGTMPSLNAGSAHAESNRAAKLRLVEALVFAIAVAFCILISSIGAN